jgi:hypothetical protein
MISKYYFGQFGNRFNRSIIFPGNLAMVLGTDVRQEM